MGGINMCRIEYKKQIMDEKNISYWEASEIKGFPDYCKGDKWMSDTWYEEEKYR